MCNQQYILDISHTALFVYLLKLNFALTAKIVHEKSDIMMLINVDIKAFKSSKKLTYLYNSHFKVLHYNNY